MEKHNIAFYDLKDIKEFKEAVRYLRNISGMRYVRFSQSKVVNPSIGPIFEAYDGLAKINKSMHRTDFKVFIYIHDINFDRNEVMISIDCRPEKTMKQKPVTLEQIKFLKDWEELQD